MRLILAMAAVSATLACMAVLVSPVYIAPAFAAAVYAALNLALKK